MDKWILRAAVISVDRSFRDLLKERLFGAGSHTTLVAELSVPFSEVSEEELRTLRHAEPQLIFLDLENDPVLGIKLAQFLADAHPALRFIAVGPTLSPELLMAAMRAGVGDFLTKPVDPVRTVGSGRAAGEQSGQGERRQAA